MKKENLVNDVIRLSDIEWDANELTVFRRLDVVLWVADRLCEHVHGDQTVVHIDRLVVGMPRVAVDTVMDSQQVQVE